MPTPSCPDPIKPGVSGGRGRDALPVIARAYLLSDISPVRTEQTYPNFGPWDILRFCPGQVRRHRPCPRETSRIDRITAAVFFAAKERAGTGYVRHTPLHGSESQAI